MQSVTKIDHIYDKMDLIIQTIMSKVPDNVFYGAIKSLAVK
jgi:hypothetical protein